MWVALYSGYYGAGGEGWLCSAIAVVATGDAELWCGAVLSGSVYGFCIDMVVVDCVIIDYARTLLNDRPPGAPMVPGGCLGVECVDSGELSAEYE